MQPKLEGRFSNGRRLCTVDRRFYFDGGDFVSIQSLRWEISYQSRRDSVSGETLFRDTGRNCLAEIKPNLLIIRPKTFDKPAFGVYQLHRIVYRSFFKF